MNRIYMYKKGDKKDPSQYRGINLLDTALKLIATSIRVNRSHQPYQTIKC